MGVVVFAGLRRGGDSGPSAYKEPSAPADETLTIEAGNFYFKPDTPTVTPGIVKLELDGARAGTRWCSTTARCRASSSR